MSRKFTFTLLAVVFAWHCASAQSDTTNVANLHPEKKAFDKKSLIPKVSGYLQVGYTYSETRSDFEAKRVRLIVSGNLHPKITYLAQVAFEGMSPTLCDAQIDFAPLREVRFTVGQMRLPFAIENQYNPLREEAIDYSMALNRLVAAEDVCGLRAGGRDIGVMMHGSFFNKSGKLAILRYNIGVYNGSGINAKDNNRSKDVVGRIILSPVEGLSLSGSYYWGEYGKDYLRRERFAGGAEYTGHNLFMRTEYIGGITGYIPDEGSHQQTFRSEGCYALLGYWVIPQLAPLVRYEYFKENCAQKECMNERILVGLDYRPIKYLRCQLNYTYSMYRHDNRPDENRVSILLTGMF